MIDQISEEDEEREALEWQRQERARKIAVCRNKGHQWGRIVTLPIADGTVIQQCERCACGRTIQAP